MDPALAGFDALTRTWFHERFGAVTEPQRLGWPEIQAGRDVLISAPTGSGKTLAAFLTAIDGLVRQARTGALPDRTQVLYVSPLKALSNDVHKNLDIPLAGVSEVARTEGIPIAPIRTAVPKPKSGGGAKSGCTTSPTDQPSATSTSNPSSPSQARRATSGCPAP